MLKEYILDNMQLYQKQLSEKTKEYKTICETEKTIQENIDRLHGNADMDFEIFSPRMGDKSLRGRMNDYYSKLKEVQNKKSALKHEINRISSELEKFKIMAAELLALEKQAQGNKNK